MFSIIVAVLFVIKIYSNSVHSLPKNIRNTSSFCHPLFCHSGVKCIFRNETCLPNITEIPYLIDWIRPWVKTGMCPFLEIRTKNQKFPENLTSRA